MNHPRDSLSDYALGILDADEAKLVEHHLATCAQCQAEVYELNEGLLALTQELPPVSPPESTWSGILEKIQVPFPESRPVRQGWLSWLTWTGLGLAAVLVGLLGYGALRERGRLENLLNSLSQAQEVLVLERDGSVFGRAFLLGERCLMVLHRPPPRGKVYQVWSYQNGAAVSLGTFRERSFEVAYGGYERMEISLEPFPGSPQPTEPLAQFRVW